MAYLKKFASIALLALTIGITSPASAAENVVIESGTVQSPVNNTEQRAVTYGGGYWLAATMESQISRSIDGKTWTYLGVTGADATYGMAYGNGKFVAVGEQQITVSSDNGETWTLASPNLPNYFDNIAFGDGYFVIADFDNCNGHSYFSTDGLNWTEVVTPDSECWTDIAFGDGKFMIVGSAHHVLVSSDHGQTWNRIADSDEINHVPYAVEYGNGRFMVIAANNVETQILTTTDANLWSSVTFTSGPLTEGTFSNLTIGNGVWLATSTRYEPGVSVAISRDNGATWVSVKETDGFVYKDANYANGIFVLAGRFEGVTVPSGRLLNGLAWTTLALEPSEAEPEVLANTGSNLSSLTLVGVAGLLAVFTGILVRRRAR